MKNGKGIKVIIVLVVVIALVVIGGLKIKNVYDGFMGEYKGTESASGTDVTIEIPEGASSKKVAGSVLCILILSLVIQMHIHT